MLKTLRTLSGMKLASPHTSTAAYPTRGPKDNSVVHDGLKNALVFNKCLRHKKLRFSLLIPVNGSDEVL